MLLSLVKALTNGAGFVKGSARHARFNVGTQGTTPGNASLGNLGDYHCYCDLAAVHVFPLVVRLAVSLQRRLIQCARLYGRNTVVRLPS